jgi:O-antigen/teichoic acid export membrane protein
MGVMTPPLRLAPGVAIAATLWRHWRALTGSALVEVVNAATSLAAVFAIGHRLGASGFGQYAFAVTVAGTSAVMALPGLMNAVIVAEARNEVAFVQKAVQRRRFWSIPVGAVVVGVYFTPLVDRIHPTLAAWVTLGVATSANISTSLVLAALTGRQAYGRLARAQAFPSLVGVLVVSTVPGVKDGTWIAAAQLFGSASIQAFELLRREGSHEQAQVPQVAGAPSAACLTRFGREMSVVGLFGAVESRLDILLVGGIGGALLAGTYALAQKFAELLKRALIILNRVTLPLWSGRPVESARGSAKRLAILSAIGGALATVVAPLSAGPLSRFLFGSAPAHISLLTFLLVAGTAIGYPSAIFESYFSSRAEARPIAAMRIAPTVVFLAGAPFLVASFGIVGLASWRLVRGAVSLCCGVALFTRQRRRPVVPAVGMGEPR